MRIGYWLGDTSLDNGGTAPYAWRTLRLLMSNFPTHWKLVILCHKEALENVLALSRGAEINVEVNLIPHAPAGISYVRRRLRPVQAGTGSNSHSSVASPSPRSVKGGFTRIVAGASDVTTSVRTNYLRWWINRRNIDVLHCPAQMPPVSNLSVPYIVTMHDVQELHFPEYFTPDARAFRATRYWHSMKHASEVVVSFGHVKDDLIKYFSLPKDKIHVCAISLESFSMGQTQPGDDSAYTKKYASWLPYLLYPAQTWRHKNHLRLLEALHKVRHQHEMDLRLICTGFKSDYYAEIERQIERLNLREAVQFTGVLPEDELSWLYGHTALVVIPTEYEAGSYPLFEAMLHKAPVICSEVTSLPETIGDRRYVFNPYDVEGLANLIHRMTTDENLRRENIGNSAEQVQRLRRVDAAAAFHEVYRHAVIKSARQL